MTPGEWLSGKWFNFIHRHNLVYNTCWEDPRLDRAALNLGPTDTLLVITSAGCNVLDYALARPQHIYAVDMNPRQNALLELKLAGIRHLDYATFFALFGRGRLANFPSVYRGELRPALSPAARQYWDRHLDFFTGARRSSFYFHGTSGTFARLLRFYIDRLARVREALLAIFDAPTIAEQRAIYERDLREVLGGRFLRWALGRDTTLSLVGVPRPQRQQVERGYAGGVVQFIEDCVEAVFARLPLRDNYFWRVYCHGEYTADCCPEYLKPDNFARLKAGLMDRISVHTASILDFLARHPGRISRYVLLDHMDWLSTFRYPVLEREWQAIVDHAAPGCRVIWRSGGLRVDYVDPISVTAADGRPRRVGELLTYHPELAAQLHARDRVHTYGSFYIADLATA